MGQLTWRRFTFSLSLFSNVVLMRDRASSFWSLLGMVDLYPPSSNRAAGGRPGINEVRSKFVASNNDDDGACEALVVLTNEVVEGANAETTPLPVANTTTAARAKFGRVV